MIPDDLKNLCRASRDFAELTSVYRDPKELIVDIRLAIEHIAQRDGRIDELQRRINQIRNARDEIIVGVQDVMKRFDSTLRAI
jgi:uncharacterized coiled-coil DUF342 family protein